MSDTLQNVCILDESVVTAIRNAGFTCESDTGNWYLTDCPLQHGVSIAGVVRAGSLVTTEQAHRQEMKEWTGQVLSEWGRMYKENVK